MLIWCRSNLLVQLLPFEAQWDGDTDGWVLYMSAITADFQSHPLGRVSHGGDIRLFQGEVPPWPEGVTAQRLGDELSQRFHAEFYFPSPHHPEDECPPFNERSRGSLCRRCGTVLLSQDEWCPSRGTVVAIFVSLPRSNTSNENPTCLRKNNVHVRNAIYVCMCVFAEDFLHM